jgi:Holliday junction resolvase RusA-like endonuclease
MIAFEIPGAPMAKLRARGGRFGHYTPTRTVNAEAVVKLTAAQHFPAPLEGPIALDILAVFAPPKSWSGAKAKRMLGAPHTQKPDWDNLGKLVSDALNGIAYADDGQVASAQVTKLWGAAAKTVITVRQITRGLTAEGLSSRVNAEGADATNVSPLLNTAAGQEPRNVVE